MVELQVRLVNPLKVPRDLDRLRANIITMVGPAIDQALGLVKTDAVSMVRVRTGKTRGTIGTMRSGLRGHVGSNWYIARFLERGTKYMSPRSFLEPAVDKNEQQISDLIIAAINTAISKTEQESGNA